MTKTKDILLWIATAFCAVFFIFVMIAMVRTMNANDDQFRVPPTNSTGAR